MRADRPDERNGAFDNVIPFPGTVLPSDDEAVPQVEFLPRRDTTLLCAQLRGWSEVTDAIGEEAAAAALRSAVDAAVETLGQHGGTDLMIEGAPGEPTLTATFTGSNGALHAVTAAASVRLAIARAQSPAAPEHQFRIGTGVDTGSVQIDRTSEGLTYQVTGTLHASAARLRDFAGPGQIFLTDTTLSYLGGAVTVQPLGPVRIDPAGDARETYSLTTLN